MPRPYLLLATVALAVAACRPERPKLPDLPQAFSNLPLPPDAQFVSRSGSADALMLAFTSPVAADSVTGYYRRLFRADTSYHVLGDSKGSAGEQAFYVEVRSRPLWVRIRPDASSGGSVVELTGAVVTPPESSAAAAPAAPAPR